MTDYKPQELDKKWQQHWTATRAFEVAADPGRAKSAFMAQSANRRTLAAAAM